MGAGMVCYLPGQSPFVKCVLAVTSAMSTNVLSMAHTLEQLSKLDKSKATDLKVLILHFILLNISSKA